MLYGFLLALVLCLSFALWRATRAEKYKVEQTYAPEPGAYETWFETETIKKTGRRNMVCKRPPKGWICDEPANHEGDCDARPNISPVHFLRRNSKGKLERLVTDGTWTGWISAEPGTRYWYVWAAIAKARGI